MKEFKIKSYLLRIISISVLFFSDSYAYSGQSLLNYSYDTTRELYKNIDALFEDSWKKKTNNFVLIRTVHGGSRVQTNAVVDGAPADVVTLAASADIDFIVEKTHKIDPDWRSKYPNNSSPYSSVIVLLVRKGNPKNIHDWDDLAKPNVKVITPNPKTSGVGRYNYLALWAFAETKYDKHEISIINFMRKVRDNSQHKEFGARGASILFMQRNEGDVLPTWESEAFLALQEFGYDKFDIVVPSQTIKADFPVAVVTKNAIDKGNENIANAYVEFLFSPAVQALLAKYHFRPAFPKFSDEKDLSNLIKVNSLGIDEAFGGWDKAQHRHFDDGGTWDQIQEK